MNRTVAGLVAEYWGACIQPKGRNTWCSVHESRWRSATYQFCDQFRDLSDFVEYIRTADAEAKP